MQVFLSLFLGLLPVALFIGAFFVPIEYADYLLFSAPIFVIVAIIYETKTQQIKLYTIGSDKKHHQTIQNRVKREKTDTVEVLGEMSSVNDTEVSENDAKHEKMHCVNEDNTELKTEELDLTPKNLEDTMFDPSDIEWDSDMRLKPRTKSI